MPIYEIRLSQVAEDFHFLSKRLNPDRTLFSEMRKQKLAKQVSALP